LSLNDTHGGPFPGSECAPEGRGSRRGAVARRQHPPTRVAAETIGITIPTKTLHLMGLKLDKGN
jgi:hypothetical protein